MITFSIVIFAPEEFKAATPKTFRAEKSRTKLASLTLTPEVTFRSTPDVMVEEVIVAYDVPEVDWIVISLSRTCGMAKSCEPAPGNK